MSSVAKQSAQTLVFNVIVTGLTIVTGMIIARTLGPAGSGIVAIAVMTPVMLTLIGNLGIQTSIVYFIGQKDSDPGIFFITATIISLVIGIFISALLWILKAITTATIMKGLSTPVYIMSLCGVPLMIWFNAMAAILIGRTLVMEYNKTTVVQPLLTLILTIIFVLILKWSVFGAVLAFLIGSVVRNIISVLYVWRYLGIKGGFSWQLTKRILAYGWRAHLGNAATQLNNRMDVYIINALGTLAGVGIYQKGVSMAELMYRIPESLRTAIHSRLVADTNYANQATPRACRQMLLICITLGVVGFFVCEPVIILLYGKDFAPAAYPFRLLLPGIISMSLSNLLFADLQARGKPMFTAYASMIGLVPTVALDFLLIPRMGISGAAIASSISYTAVMLFAWASFSKFSGVPMIEVVKIRKQDTLIYRDIATKIWRKLRR